MADYAVIRRHERGAGRSIPPPSMPGFVPRRDQSRGSSRHARKASDARRRIPAVYVIVLGIDPGVAHTGYGVVAQHRGRMLALDGGVVETAPGLDAGRRLVAIHERVGALLDEHRPDALALEDLYFGANAHSAFAVGQARGVAMLAAGQRGVPTASYTPQQVKSAVCGNGRAAKDQVQRMVQTLLALTELPRPDHAADALAVAICHANGAPLSAALAG
jgi:crossover junction endodeoxyribonuclease RuvC